MLPEVVVEDEDGYLTVAYSEIVPVLINAFNEHMAIYNKEQSSLKQRFDEFAQELEAVSTGKYNCRASPPMLTSKQKRSFPIKRPLPSWPSR